MDITPLVRPELKLIQSYGHGFFRINGDIYQHSVIVVGDHVHPWDGQVQSLSQFDELTQGGLDVLLIGMGQQMGLPLSPSQRAALSLYGMTIDSMDTAAACRTYNVLTAEGRRVAAALKVVS